jgi:hypothetical protein
LTRSASRWLSQLGPTVGSMNEIGRESIGLVGCVKSKLCVPAPARELYISPLFRGRRAWVERTCDRWFILSAKYGLVGPDEVMEPYDEWLKTASRADRRKWASHVLTQMKSEFGLLSGYRFEVHAGAEYFDFGLRDGLLAAGAEVVVPTEHLRQGQQGAFYKRGNADA